MRKNALGITMNISKKLIFFIIFIILVFTILSYVNIPERISNLSEDTEKDSVFVHRNTTEFYSPPKGEYYAYAPSIIKKGSIYHCWTCQNFKSGVFRDHIGYNKIGLDKKRKNPRKSVLSPGPVSNWDSVHVCDPSVVKGPFSYDDDTYEYALFYLGCNRTDIKNNQIGIAFSKTIENGGKWRKGENINPIIEYKDPENEMQWGVGQPSALNIQGEIWLFYTVGDSHGTYGVYRKLDTDNLVSISEKRIVTNEGLRRIDGSSPDTLNNFDIAYSEEEDKFVAVRSQHTSAGVWGGRTYPKFITKAVEVVSIPRENIKNGSWKRLFVIDNRISGYPRNHNAGLVTGEEGHLKSLEEIEIVYAVSCAEDSDTPCEGTAEWSYHLLKSTFQK